MSRVTHMNESRLPRLSHGTPVHESRHAYEYDMSHICMSHVTHVNKTCRKYECVSRMSINDVTLLNESR